MIFSYLKLPFLFLEITTLQSPGVSAKQVSVDTLYRILQKQQVVAFLFVQIHRNNDV